MKWQVAYNQKKNTYYEAILGGVYEMRVVSKLRSGDEVDLDGDSFLGTIHQNWTPAQKESRRGVTVMVQRGSRTPVNDPIVASFEHHIQNLPDANKRLLSSICEHPGGQRRL